MGTAKKQERGYDFDLAARTIMAHIAKGDQYTEKGEQHYKAAGKHLMEAKAAVGHGDWLPFLASINLHERKAQRLMLKVTNPVIGESHTARAYEYKQEQKAEPNTTSDVAFAEPSPAPKVHKRPKLRAVPDTPPPSNTPDEEELKYDAVSALRDWADEHGHDACAKVMEWIKENYNE